jgi:hypothetical protein
MVLKPARTLMWAVTTLSLVPVAAFGWGATGHRFIGEVAIRALPDEVPAFLRTDDVARQAGELAREPDRWRGSGQIHDSERDPGHFVDVSDDLTVLGGPQLAALPATRSDYDTALRAVGATQYKAGYLPYSIVDGFQQLKTDFAYWRVDVAGAKFAKDDKARDWFDKDRALREMLTIRDLGVWAHFVGDGSQPMHASVHYDGWGNFPNPDGYSTRHGIHLHFEGAYVHDNVAEPDVAALVPSYRDCSCAIEVRTAQYLTATNAQIVPLFQLDKAHAFEIRTPEGKAFATARVAAGAAELRDMIVDVWHASADAKVGFPQISVSDVESGKADALGPLMGED